MRPVPRSVTVMAALTVFGGAVTACTASAGSPPAPDWRACPENPGFECATIAVPVDWSDPAGDHIDMSLILDRANDPAHTAGTLVSLPGGPGTSGVDEILAGDHFSPQLHDRFDIVGLDPRGVKRSNPIRCDAALANTRPNLVPDAGGELSEIRSYGTDLTDSCRKYTGALLDHMDAVSVARDVDALRTALGRDQLTLYSRSYGTMSAQAYAELFPQHLRASVLDSVDDHSRDGAQFLGSSARAGEDSFAEFTRWCAREPSCSLHGTNVARLYAGLFDAATEGRLRDPADPQQPLGPLDVSQRTTARLDDPDWSGLAHDLTVLDHQPLAPPAAPPEPARSGGPVDFPSIAVCADWNFEFDDQSQWLRAWHAQHDRAPTLRAHFAWAAGSLCSGMPITPANPPHAPRDTGAPPVLILNSRHDPATPHEWATRVTAGTARAHLLTYEGWGHGVYDRTPCTTASADRYLVDLDMPSADSCPAG